MNNSYNKIIQNIKNYNNKMREIYKNQSLQIINMINFI